MPLNHDHLFSGSYENSRNTRKKRKQTGENKKLTKDKFRHSSFAVTTYLPPLYSQLEVSTLYPPLDLYYNSFSNDIANTKPIDFNQSPPTGTIEPKLEFPNEQNRYDVKEETSDTPIIISVTESNQSQQENQQTQDQFRTYPLLPSNTTAGPRKRGRNLFRGRSRF